MSDKKKCPYEGLRGVGQEQIKSCPFIVEVASLKAEIEEWKEGAEVEAGEADKGRAEIASLKAEVEKLRSLSPEELLRQNDGSFPVGNGCELVELGTMQRVKDLEESGTKIVAAWDSVSLSWTGADWTTPTAQAIDTMRNQLPSYPANTESATASKELKANRKPGHPWDEPLSDTERGT